MKRPIAIAFLLASVSFVLADGGVPIGQIEKDGIRVSVFALPFPARVGPLDVSFLVQEIPSNQPITDADISCTVRNLDPVPLPSARLPAWCASVVPGAVYPATRAHAKNKLLKGTYVPLTGPGRWNLQFRVQHKGFDFLGSLPLAVAPPRSPLADWWPLLLLPPLAIALYIWRLRLLCDRRERRQQRLSATPTL